MANRIYQGKVFAVAPMLDWTDRHCRYFHRLLTSEALLYSEMVVTQAAIHGKRDRLLGFDPVEHPLALQLGGADADQLAESARIGAGFGYDEININVGCPSDRVQSGTFGACLMLEPGTVARGVAAMKAAVDIPVTVKCRIGVDEQDSEIALDDLAQRVIDAGADAIWVHARKAWLKGLSPRENRDIPPLDHDRVYRLKQTFPDVFIGINGGIGTLAEAVAHLDHVDGVMLGRAAYHEPALLAGVDSLVYGKPEKAIDWLEIRDRMMAYAGRHIAAGGRLNQVTRHMLGLFAGRPGARRYRQILSTETTRLGAGPDIIQAAFAAVDFSNGEALDPADREASRFIG